MDVRGKVLVIDDDPVSRLVLRHQLTEIGFEVAESEDAESAQTDFDPSEFQAIFCDQDMPGISGLELIEVWQGATEAKFILITGYLEWDELADDRSLVDAYLSKPVSSIRLRAELEKLSFLEVQSQ